MGSLVTLGTATFDCPLETTMAIREPLFAVEPNAGLVEITCPFCTVADGRLVTAPMAKPWLCSELFAAVRVSPATSGTEMPLLPSVRNTNAKMATASTTTVVITATHGHILRRGCSSAGPSPSDPYRYGGMAAVRAAAWGARPLPPGPAPSGCV